MAALILTDHERRTYFKEFDENYERLKITSPTIEFRDYVAVRRLQHLPNPPWWLRPVPAQRSDEV